MNCDSLAYVERLYRQYLRDPASLGAEWRQWFADGGEIRTRHRAVERAPAPAPGHRQTLQDRVDQLIRGYRVRGHLAAQIDPLRRPRPRNPELELETWGLSSEDLGGRVSTKSLPGPDRRSLQEIVDQLEETYCRSIGVQFMHIDSREIRNWLQERMEGSRNRLTMSREQQRRILTLLTDAEVFEAFTRRKFVGAKTFSLEGAESLIPLLDLALERAAHHGILEIVMGMAHRGRLNVLANILGKREKNIFLEFDDSRLELDDRGVDDVRYHLGYSGTWRSLGGHEIHVSLCFNPSHLEFVGPVALGRMRAKQSRYGDRARHTGMVVLVHGDAAFAGEGVVQETLNLSRLPGYETGGTLHIVVNNQIGFTTEPAAARSTVYATDVGRMLQVPIFHVNGEDPEAVARVVEVAIDFRARFRRDVIIDLYAYRRLGHNEGDEPRFTQPRMYAAIDAMPSVRQAYMKRLEALTGLGSEEADAMVQARRAKLEREFEATRTEEFVSDYSKTEETWSQYVGGPEPDDDDPDTGIGLELARQILTATATVPPGFQPHRKLQRWLERRRRMASGEQELDFGAAEALALASLSLEGTPIRMSGQDAQRGTFSHRHAVLHDTETGGQYMPLANLGPGQASLRIYNSPLSEAGVLGFEYGVSLDYPDALVVWEAQFGDFWNTAQVIVDQFIASAEEKWGRLSGLVLLLPHGYEGQGPEHSSARPERLLQLSTGRNIQLAYPSTPAQYFHLLRRQVRRRWRKPLFVLTPKSMLRLPRAVSSLEDCAGGRFHKVIPDTSIDPEQARRILMCSGKVYWDLLARRQQLGAADVSILRLEQLAPYPDKELRETLAPYVDGTPVHWVQEEARNMGFWHYLKLKSARRPLGDFPLGRISRPVSASPATGSASTHKRQQEQLLEAAFAGDEPARQEEEA